MIIRHLHLFLYPEMVYNQQGSSHSSLDRFTEITPVNQGPLNHSIRIPERPVCTHKTLYRDGDMVPLHFTPKREAGRHLL